MSIGPKVYILLGHKVGRFLLHKWNSIQLESK